MLELHGHLDLLVLTFLKFGTNEVENFGNATVLHMFAKLLCVPVFSKDFQNFQAFLVAS